ncbi:MAG: TrmH family RNA methyltransferase [Vulcanimicrobiaceae bacterium]
MPTVLGAHAPRIGLVRALLTPKGRREQKRFIFEGATLLGEARRSGHAIVALIATASALEACADARALEGEGTPVYLVDERTFAKLSDVQTPTGLLGIAAIPQTGVADILCRSGLALAIADLSDPGNVGTLLRSAEAFSATGAILGRNGADPYQPKVVRAAMGSLFRLPIARTDPQELAAAAKSAGSLVVGLDSDGEPLEDAVMGTDRLVILVGHERAGLGPWAAACSRVARIPMRGPAESLNAAIAGSIALYEATRLKAVKRVLTP